MAIELSLALLHILVALAKTLFQALLKTVKNTCSKDFLQNLSLGLGIFLQETAEIILRKEDNLFELLGIETQNLLNLVTHFLDFIPKLFNFLTTNLIHND